MTEPANLGEIVVTGQRRSNDSMSPFPSAPNYDPPLPGQDATIEPDTGNHPCDDPVAREHWNKDAAVAAAARALDKAARDAGENGLTYRERAAFLLRSPNGTYSIGPIKEGSVFAPAGSTTQPMTPLDPNLVDMSQIVGIVHNHNVGQHGPSDPDGIYGGDEAALKTVRDIMNHYNPGSGNAAMSYIVAQTAGANAYNKISAYSLTTIKYDANGNPPPVGPEVNPNGQSCPL